MLSLAFIAEASLRSRHNVFVGTAVSDYGGNLQGMKPTKIPVKKLVRLAHGAWCTVAVRPLLPINVNL